MHIALPLIRLSIRPNAGCKLRLLSCGLCCLCVPSLNSSLGHKRDVKRWTHLHIYAHNQNIIETKHP